MPNLVSFLANKGFSTEQIDKIVLSSRNEEGLLQIHKLVTAMQSAKRGMLSEETGLVIETANVPRVQELLLNMGLGAGEVRDAIEKAGDQRGGISLDKLADALNEQLQGSISKTGLVSLLEQNNIRVTSQTTDTAAVASDVTDNTGLNSQISNIATGISGLEKDVTVSDYNAKISDDGVNLQNGINRDLKGYDINKAAVELKKEFMDFVNGSSRGLDGTEKQKAGVRLNEKAAQAQESNSLRSMPDIDNTGANPLKAAAQVPAQDGSPIARALSSGQRQWVKGDEGKIIDILNGDKQLDIKVSSQEITPEEREIMKDPAGFLKQADRKTGQEMLNGISDGKTVSQTETNEMTDMQDGLLNIRETHTIDLTSQNTARVSDGIELKGHVKTAYNLPEPLPRVFDRMVIMIKNGEQTGKLMIQPPELGKIDIDLSIKSGHVQANLTTENLAVKEIIEANLNQLKQQLNDQGLIVEQLNVSVGSHNRQFGEEYGQAGKSGKGSSRSGAAGIEETAAMDEGATLDILTGRYRVDLRV